MSNCNRRKFLAYATALPATVALARTAPAECVDPDELSDGVRGMRDSMEYADAAPDPRKACNGCRYFKPAKAGDSCGNCEVLGGVVSAKGYCVSWTGRK